MNSPSTVTPYLSWPKRLSAWAAAKIAVGLPPLVVLGLYGLVQSIRQGFQLSEHSVFMIGAVLSMVAMVAYGMQAVSSVLEKPSRWGRLIFAGSFVPLLFAGYVVVDPGRLSLQIWRQRGPRGRSRATSF